MQPVLFIDHPCMQVGTLVSCTASGLQHRGNFLQVARRKQDCGHEKEDTCC